MFSKIIFTIFICCQFLNVYSLSFYSHTVLDADGKEFSLENYKGKVSLVVNVASKCGYTDASYRALSRLHDILSYNGFFSVLAFPCNQFGDQEPEEIADIVENVKSEYGVEFPIFDKIDVIGPTASPAFQYLIEQSSIAPEWNFYKYLVDGKGDVLNAWGTRTSIEEIFEEIQTAVTNAEREAKEPYSSESTPSDEDSKEDIPKDEL